MYEPWTSFCFSTGPNDYTDVNAISLSFTNSNLRQCFQIQIQADDVFEGDESFTVTLSSPSPLPDFPRIRITPDVATITIQDTSSECIARVKWVA